MRAPGQTKAKAETSERGILGLLGVLICGGCLPVALVGVLNTAFNLKLMLRVYGSRTPLPASYEQVGGVAAAGVLLIGLSMFGSFEALDNAVSRARQ